MQGGRRFGDETYFVIYTFYFLSYSYLHAYGYICDIHTDPTFVRTFLTTYRSFSKPEELLDLLILRFHIPDPDLSSDVDDVEFRRDPVMMKAYKQFKATYVSPIQLRSAVMYLCVFVFDERQWSKSPPVAFAWGT